MHLTRISFLVAVHTPLLLCTNNCVLMMMMMMMLLLFVVVAFPTASRNQPATKPPTFVQAVKVHQRHNLFILQSCHPHVSVCAPVPRQHAVLCSSQERRRDATSGDGKRERERGERERERERECVCVCVCVCVCGWVGARVCGDAHLHWTRLTFIFMALHQPCHHLVLIVPCEKQTKQTNKRSALCSIAPIADVASTGDAAC